jgi:hypothetical protein
MGIGVRIFLVTDDNCLERLSLMRYERLLRYDPTEHLPQYAGKRLRHVLVVLEMEHRKPVGIRKIEYGYLHFDSEGKLDIIKRERKARMAMELFPSLSDDEHPPQVIDARHLFARKRYSDEYHWQPSREMGTAIVEAIFGKTQR